MTAVVRPVVTFSMGVRRKKKKCWKADAVTVESQLALPTIRAQTRKAPLSRSPFLSIPCEEREGRGR